MQWKGCSRGHYPSSMQNLRLANQTRLPLWILLGLAFALVGADCGTRMKARGYEGSGRDSWQQTERVVAALGLRAGQRVADVGSGSGYFTGHLAGAVAPGGHVYAVDVDASMNAYLEKRMAEEGVENVSTVLATADDPGLPADGVDVVFTSNTFHHLPDQQSYFTSLKKYLRPGARVAIVEYEPEKAGWFARTFGHATVKGEIAGALEGAGFRLVEDHDFLDRQSFQIFEILEVTAP